MANKPRRHHRYHSRLGCGIPRQIWVLIEVLIVALVLHYAHIPIEDILPLIKLFVP